MLERVELISWVSEVNCQCNVYRVKSIGRSIHIYLVLLYYCIVVILYYCVIVLLCYRIVELLYCIWIVLKWKQVGELSANRGGGSRSLFRGHAPFEDWDLSFEGFAIGFG